MFVIVNQYVVFRVVDMSFNEFKDVFPVTYFIIGVINILKITLKSGFVIYADYGIVREIIFNYFFIAQ